MKHTFYILARYGCASVVKSCSENVLHVVDKLPCPVRAGDFEVVYRKVWQTFEKNCAKVRVYAETLALRCAWNHSYSFMLLWCCDGQRLSGLT